MAEALAQPRLVLVGIQPDADHASRDLVRELRVVAGGDPDAADREADHLRLAEHPVLPVGRGQRRGHRGCIQLPAQVVDQHDRGDLAQLGGQALAPLVLVAALDHDAGAGAGGDDRDHIDHEGGAGAGRRLLDHVQRRRARDHRPDEGQQQERQRMRPLGVADEREVAEQVVEQQ